MFTGSGNDDPAQYSHAEFLKKGMRSRTQAMYIYIYICMYLCIHIHISDIFARKGIL